MRARLWLGALAAGVPLGAQPNGAPAERADLWNFPNRNYFVCARLAGDSAPTRYADGRLVSERGAYQVRTRDARYRGTVGGPTAADRQACRPGEVRLDAHEAVTTTAGLLLHWHKGGQGYADSRVPYGYVLASDLVNGDAVPVQRPLSAPPEWGAPSWAKDRWDAERRNGRGCEPVAGETYRVAIVPQGSPDAIPKGWQYKPNQGTSNYLKYSDAGPEQGDGSAHYAYLVWSWLVRGDGVTTSGGGGMVRSLLRDGQPFERCNVQPIDGIAYAQHTGDEAGRVTAVYGRTRASAEAPWLYGWAIFSHRAKRPDGSYAPDILHMRK